MSININMATKSLDGVLTKKAHLKEKFNEEAVEDLKKCRSQFNRWINKVCGFTKKVKG